MSDQQANQVESAGAEAEEPADLTSRLNALLSQIQETQPTIYERAMGAPPDKPVTQSAPEPQSSTPATEPASTPAPEPEPASEPEPESEPATVETQAAAVTADDAPAETAASTEQAEAPTQAVEPTESVEPTASVESAPTPTPEKESAPTDMDALGSKLDALFQNTTNPAPAQPTTTSAPTPASTPMSSALDETAVDQLVDQTLNQGAETSKKQDAQTLQPTPGSVLGANAEAAAASAEVPSTDAAATAAPYDDDDFSKADMEQAMTALDAADSLPPVAPPIKPTDVEPPASSADAEEALSQQIQTLLNQATDGDATPTETQSADETSAAAVEDAAGAAASAASNTESAEPTVNVQAPTPPEAPKPASEKQELVELDQMLAVQADQEISKETTAVETPSAEAPAAGKPEMTEAERYLAELQDVKEEAGLQDLQKEYENLSPDGQPKPPASDEAPAPVPTGPLLQRLIASIKRAPSELFSIEGMKLICFWLNRPLTNLPPQTRNLIGYVGLVTLFNAVAVLFFVMFS